MEDREIMSTSKQLVTLSELLRPYVSGQGWFELAALMWMCSGSLLCCRGAVDSDLIQVASLSDRKGTCSCASYSRDTGQQLMLEMTLSALMLMLPHNLAEAFMKSLALAAIGSSVRAIGQFFLDQCPD